MLDGLFKAKQDRFWDKVGRAVARTGITPNQVTVLSTLLVAVNAGAYVWHRHPALFGGLLALCELLDDVDGAVARVTSSRTKFGAYLDAVTDRYKDAIALGVVGHVEGAPLLALLCVTGAACTSYNKARAGMEIPISNEKWPDLFERFERIAVLVIGLVLDPFLGPTLAFGHRPIHAALAVIATFSILTSFQRLLRARRLFVERGDPPT